MAMLAADAAGRHQRRQQPLPRPAPRPAIEAVVDGGRRALGGQAAVALSELYGRVRHACIVEGLSQGRSLLAGHTWGITRCRLKVLRPP
jgi:hypothetical protein